MWGGGGVWLLGAGALASLSVVGVWGCGLLFEIWIVDASIKFFFVVVSSVHHQPGVPAAAAALLLGVVSWRWWVGWVGGVCDKL